MSGMQPSSRYVGPQQNINHICELVPNLLSCRKHIFHGSDGGAMVCSTYNSQFTCNSCVFHCNHPLMEIFMTRFNAWQ